MIGDTIDTASSLVIRTLLKKVKGTAETHKSTRRASCGDAIDVSKMMHAAQLREAGWMREPALETAQRKQLVDIT
jgi:hypothetical protein